MSMRILIVTPLFPPDISVSAKYTKELTDRLSASHTVTVLHFGRLPEKISDVSFVSIPKKLSVWRRLWSMTFAIIQHSKQVDVVLMQNGPSVELPMLLASFVQKLHIVNIISDQAAFEKTSQRTFQKRVQQILNKRSIASFEITAIDTLLPPLQHPLESTDDAAQTRFTKAWDTHMQTLASNYSV